MTSSNVENKQKLNDPSSMVKDESQPTTLTDSLELQGDQLDKELEITKFVQYYISMSPIITLFDLKNAFIHFIARNNWKYDLDEFLNNDEVHKLFNFPRFIEPKIFIITSTTVSPILFLYLTKNKDIPFNEDNFLIVLAREIKAKVNHLSELGVRIRIVNNVEKKTEEKSVEPSFSPPKKNGSPSYTTTVQSEMEYPNSSRFQCEFFTITDCLRIFIDLLMFYYPSIPLSFSMLRQKIQYDLKKIETQEFLRPYFVFLTLFYAKNIDNFDIIKNDIGKNNFARYLRDQNVEKDSFLQFVQLAFTGNSNVCLIKNLGELDELATLITKMFKNHQHPPRYKVQMINDVVSYLDKGYDKIEILDFILSDPKFHCNKETIEKRTRYKKQKTDFIKSPPTYTFQTEVIPPTLQENDTTPLQAEQTDTLQNSPIIKLKYSGPVSDELQETYSTQTPHNTTLDSNNKNKNRNHTLTTSTQPKNTNEKKINTTTTTTNNNKNENDEPFDFDMNVEIEDDNKHKPSPNHLNHTNPIDTPKDIDLSVLIANF